MEGETLLFNGLRCANDIPKQHLVGISRHSAKWSLIARFKIHTELLFSPESKDSCDCQATGICKWQKESIGYETEKPIFKD